MRIYAALYTTTDQPNRPILLDAWSADMVEASPAGWRGVLAQEATNEDVAAIAPIVIEVPDADALAALTVAPTVLSAHLHTNPSTGD